VKGRNPTAKEKRHMDKVSQLGCIVCRNQGNLFVPSEIHHTQGKTKVNAHFLVLPLCFQHHREGTMNGLWVSRHPWKKGKDVVAMVKIDDEKFLVFIEK
jgi:hypothetical protein